MDNNVIRFPEHDKKVFNSVLEFKREIGLRGDGKELILVSDNASEVLKHGEFKTDLRKLSRPELIDALDDTFEDLTENELELLADAISGKGRT